MTIFDIFSLSVWAFYIDRYVSLISITQHGITWGRPLRVTQLLSLRQFRTQDEIIECCYFDALFAVFKTNAPLHLRAREEETGLMDHCSALSPSRNLRDLLESFPLNLVVPLAAAGTSRFPT